MRGNLLRELADVVMGADKSSDLRLASRRTARIQSEFRSLRIKVLMV